MLARVHSVDLGVGLQPCLGFRFLLQRVASTLIYSHY